MKRLSIILSIVLSINVWAASIVGTIKVEDSDSVGVFVYVDGQNKYDITDLSGKFKISGLKLGEDYTLVMQTGNLPDYKKNVKMTGENTVVEILIPKDKKASKVDEESKIKETPKEVKKEIVVSKPVIEKNKNEGNNSDNKAIKITKYSVNGKLNSALTSDVFLQLSNQGYGIIVKPNSNFNLKLNPGKYTATFIQDGAITKKITFNVAKSDLDLGTIIMEGNDYNVLTLKFEETLESGIVQMYKDGFLEYAAKISKNSKEFLLKGLKKGVYDVVVKTPGKQDYISTFNIIGNSSINIIFDKLNKEDRLFLDIYPKDTAVKVRLLNGLEVIREIDAKDLAVLDGLDPTKVYGLEVINDKYKKAEIKRVVSGDSLEVNLIRDIKGTLISGYVSPFNSNAKVMVLDNGEIIGEASTDENGYYEIEFLNRLIGEKTLRFSSENFKSELINQKFSMDKNIYEQNMMLKPASTKINGTVSFGKGEPLTNALVVIEQLGIWQFTNSKGEYYFNNIDEGEYEVTFKKMGYNTIVEKVSANSDENSVKNVYLDPIGKVVFRSNIEGYSLAINGKNINVNQKLYEYIQGMGVVNISAMKVGYLPINLRIKLTEAGEIRDVFLDFVNIEEQNKDVKNKIDTIKLYIKDLKITEAESLLEELSQIKSLKSYEKDYLDIRSKLSNAKLKLFDIDRSIKFELEKVKDNIKREENSKIGYVEKNKNLTRLYKESLDYLGKIILSHPYTTYRYDIHMLQSEIYVKMGMPNSSKASIEEAQKYENRRKE